MRKVVILLALSLLLTVVLPTFSVGESPNTDITFTKVATYTDTVYNIAVYGESMALEIMHSNHTEIYYSATGVPEDITNTPDIDELNPAVSSEGAVWEKAMRPCNIWGTDGEISTSPYDDSSPRIDGSRVVYLEDDQNFNTSVILDDLHSTSRKTVATLNEVINSVDISGDKIIYVGDSSGAHLYNINTGTTENILSYAEEALIGGDIVTYTYLSNFGKDVEIAYINLDTQEGKVVSDIRLGYYPYLQSIDADENFIVWAFDYTGYIYNIATDTLETMPFNNSVTSVSVGGGYVGVVTHENDVWTVWRAKLPQVTKVPYVEASLIPHDANITLLIKDSEGNMLGYYAGKFYNQIPGGKVINTSGTIKYRIENQNLGKYYYYVTSYGNGHYDLKIYREESKNKGSISNYIQATWIAINKSAVHRYSVDWDKLANSVNDAVKIDIDTNGDGTFDKTATTASQNITQSIIDSAKPYQSGSENLPPTPLGNMLLEILLAVIVALIVVIVVIVARKK